MTAASGVCQVMSDRDAWWNFKLGVGLGAITTAVVAAGIIASVRSRTWISPTLAQCTQTSSPPPNTQNWQPSDATSHASQAGSRSSGYSPSSASGSAPWPSYSPCDSQGGAR